MPSLNDTWFERTRRLLEIPAPDYRRVQALTELAPDGPASLAGRVALAPDGEAWFSAALVGPRGVRLRLGPAPLAPRRTILTVGEDPPGLPGAAMSRTATGWTLRAAAGWELRIAVSPFSLALHDTLGRVRWRTESLDRKPFDGGFASPPTGLCPAGELPRAVLNFALAPDEALYGLGERFGPLDQRGQVVPIFNRGGGTWNQGYHKCVPWLLSSRGYGLFLNSPRPALFDLGFTANSAVTVAVAETELDVYLFLGEPHELLEAYTALTGRPSVPPDWSLGIWMGCHSYWSQEEVVATAERLRADGFAADVLKIDTGWFHRAGRGSPVDYDMEWNDRFPAPERMAARLHELGFRLCLFVQSWMLADSPRGREAQRLGYVLAHADGSEYFATMGPTHRVVRIDLTREAPRAWYKEQLKSLLRQGVDTFFVDWGVDSPVELNYAGGDGPAYSNTHALHYLGAAAEALAEHNGGTPGVLWSLCGCAGAQRFPVTYSGDSRTTFRDMASVLRGGLQCALSGFPLWGAEIGGFGNLELGPPDPELYVRYLQHGFLLPYAEFHGIGAREPWHYGDRAMAVYREFAALRHRLLPYLRTQVQHAARTGRPVLRPMLLEFPHDPNVRHLDLQYLLGPSLLVAPVFERGATTVRVYLPAGEWFDYWTDTAHRGPAWVEVSAPLDRLGLFVRAGTVLPIGRATQRAEESLAATPEAHRYGERAEGEWWDGAKFCHARFPGASAWGPIVHHPTSKNVP